MYPLKHSGSKFHKSLTMYDTFSSPWAHPGADTYSKFSVIRYTEHGEWETHLLFSVFFFLQDSNKMVKVEMFHTILNIRTCCIIYNIYCKIVNQVR